MNLRGPTSSYFVSLASIALIITLLLSLPCTATAANIADAGYCGEGYLYHGIPMGDGKNLTWTLDDAGCLTINGEGNMGDFADDVSFEGYTYYNLLPRTEDNNRVYKVNIKDGVTSIGEAAFGNYHFPYSNIESVTLPKSVKEIGKGSFGYCSGLKDISIPASVKTIGDYAFVGCKSLPKLEVPDSVTKLEMGVFNECSSLKSIVLPKRITSIGHSSFLDCTSLETIKIPEKVTEIGDYAFENCSSLKHIEIPNGVTSIGSEAFAGCGELSYLRLPDSVTELGSYAFADCSSLKALAVPDSITDYEGLSFIGCSSLDRVYIPAAINRISQDAFQDCWELKDIYYGGDVVEWMNMTRGMSIPSDVVVHYNYHGPIITEIKKATTSTDNTTAEIDCQPDVKATACCAFYDVNSQMINSQVKRLNAGQENIIKYTLPEKTNLIKWFVMDGNSRPLCGSKLASK